MRALLVSLLLVSASAWAQTTSKNTNYRILPSASAPTTSPTLWSPTSGPNVGKALLHNADGTDTVIGGCSGSGSVTSVGTGLGLSGGPITSTGTLNLRLNIGGGLLATLGTGSNELGIDPSIVATVSGVQTLTGKSINGGSNTLSSIANSSLVNSSLTVSGTSGVSGGGSVSLGGTTSLSLDQSFSPSWTGQHTWSFPGIGSGTSPLAISLVNPTAATSSAQVQNSPGFGLGAHGWQAGSTNADELVQSKFLLKAVAGTSLPATTRLTYQAAKGGGTLADSLYLDTDTTSVTTIISATAPQSNISFGSSIIIHSNSGIVDTDALMPNSSGQKIGNAAAGRFYDAELQQSKLKQVSVTFSATMNFDCSTGGQLTTTLTSNLGSWTISNGPGSVAERCVLGFKQDATGSRTIGTPPSTISWLPSTYRGSDHAVPTLSAGAGLTDYVYLYWAGDGSGKWVQVAENFNN